VSIQIEGEQAPGALRRSALSTKTAGNLQGNPLGTSPGSEHPPIERLAAYHRGRLSEQDEESIRDHFIACPACRKTMLELSDFLDGARHEGRWSSDKLLAAWREMQASLPR